MRASVVHSSIGARDVRPLDFTNVEHFEDLTRIGIGLDEAMVERMMEGIGLDTIQGLITTASIPSPVQFLQNWLPGFVKILTASRDIDTLVGISTIGSWEDEQVVQGVLEPAGSAVPYGDYTNVPLSSWNANYTSRTVVRFEQGMRVGQLEELRAARARINSGSEKREAAALSLEIERNLVGFYGYNNGANATYGFLNDPNLPAYVEVDNSGSGSNTEWSTKTFLQIQADILEALQSLRTQSKNTIKPDKTPITMAVAMSSVDYLSTTSDFGISVYDWLKQFYPNVRVESAVQLDAANAGENVFYLYADQVDDTSTDDKKTFIQVVPAKFQVIGVAKIAKGYEEDYSNATAGIMCKRPYAVVRRFGI